MKRLSRKTFAAALVLVGLASTALVYATLGEGLGTAPRILGLVLGAIGLFIGVAMLAPRLVRPLAHLVGAPAARLGGAAGKLARENATRNPSRTASTAAALMIGLTLVTFVAVLGKGLLGSGERSIRDQLVTSHVVTSQDDWSTVPAAAGRAVAAAPGVKVASSVRYDRGQLATGHDVDVSGIDPATIGKAYAFRWEDGSDAVLARLGRNGAIVRKDLADDETIRVGDPLLIETPSGKEITVDVAGIYDPPGIDPLLGHVLLPQPLFDHTFERPGDLYTFVTGPSEAALERSLTAYPDAKVGTADQFVSDRTAWLRIVMNLFYVLLALSVVVSLFGMVNTLVLSVFERTRELGMLRAVGMTRRQARRMIRHESVITALIGAALGLPLGIGLGALVIQALSKYGASFSLPVGTLAVFTVVAILAGIVAAVAPARRAARLDVLGALQYE